MWNELDCVALVTSPTQEWNQVRQRVAPADAGVVSEWTKSIYWFRYYRMIEEKWHQVIQHINNFGNTMNSRDERLPSDFYFQPISLKQSSKES